jgi:hypothetical protein
MFLDKALTTARLAGNDNVTSFQASMGGHNYLHPSHPSFPPFPPFVSVHADKKENQIFLICKENSEMERLQSHI